MGECSAVRERMPELLLEALDIPTREHAHAHIEQCIECQNEWHDYRQTWGMLGALPELRVPDRVRLRFLQQTERLASRGVVIPFPSHRATRWIAQAAAVVLLVGGSFFAGQAVRTSAPTESPATVESIRAAPFSLAESRVVSASQIDPEIEGRPDIENVRFLEPQGANGEVGIAFDLKSHVTVTGKPTDKSFVSLLTYVLENKENPTSSKSNAMQWVKDTYGGKNVTDPEIVRALASVLKNDSHEGVRIKAVETLRSIPAGGAMEARAALIQALNNDPNPAVRIKAIDALINLATAGEKLDPATVDTLRQKAAQNDENVYVRVKAAEALSQIDL